MFYQNMEKKEQTIKIKNNFLPSQSFLPLKELLTSGYFPWYFNDGVVHNKEPLNHYQFTHNFILNGKIHSDFYKNLLPLLDIIKPSIMIRIKANLQPVTSSIIKHTMHIDENFKNAKITAGIFYVTTNNGKTIFKTGEEIKSEENKYIEFDSKKLHTGTTCTDQQQRIVINFNYIKE